VARQKRNFKLLRSFRQPLDFHLKVSATSPNQLLATRFSTGIRCEGGASYCLVSGRQPPRIFYFRGVGEQSIQCLRNPIFQPAPAAKAAHLTVSFPPVNPFEFFIFEVANKRSDQLLRSPFFNRRPLRRGRILLCGFRASTPVVKKISGGIRRLETWLILRHRETVFHGHRANLQEPRTRCGNFFSFVEVLSGALPRALDSGRPNAQLEARTTST
jgi:hypothetical protein